MGGIYIIDATQMDSDASGDQLPLGFIEDK